MGTLNEDLTSIKTVEDTLTSNKVANFAYTDTAYENNNANGVVEYDVDQDQNIPVSTPSVLKVNETILAKGWRAKASSITRMLMNHFLGRLSYNLNKVNDNMASLLSTLQNHLGTANGLATLDSTGRIPYSQLPESAIEYKGQWNASTNTPTLADGTGTNGDFYIVSVAGIQNLGSGDIQFFENDRVIYDGSVWSRLSSGDVKTVNNISPVNGNITLTKSDVGLGNVVNTGDSATPASGGTTKFTTGGAYTELNKKQDKITNTIQSSQPSDSNYVGGFTNSSTSTNPTAHSSWTFTNIWNWVKTKLGVRNGTTDSAIGSATKPVYLNSSGKAVAVNNNAALVNLASTSSANMYASAPRPGVTGVLPVANGGTGATSLANVNVGSASSATKATNDGSGNNIVNTYATKTSVSTAEANAKNLANATGILAVANGGTGASTASGARTNLGLGSAATASLANVLSGANASGICTTAIGTKAKTVSINGFSLYEGVTVRVMFTNGNNVVTPTLNVNDTGAKEIKVVHQGVIKSLSNTNSNTAVKALKSFGNPLVNLDDLMWQQNVILELMYYNNAWVIIGNPVVIKGSAGSDEPFSYKVYADGSIEQRGYKTPGFATIYFPIKFSGSDTYYFNFIANRTDETGNGWHYYYNPKTYAILVVQIEELAMWYAEGY